MQLRFDPETGTVAEQAYLLHVLSAAYPECASFGRSDFLIGIETGRMPTGTVSLLPIVERHAGDGRPVESAPCSGGDQPFQPDRTAS